MKFVSRALILILVLIFSASCAFPGLRREVRPGDQMPVAEVMRLQQVHRQPAGFCANDSWIVKGFWDDTPGDGYAKAAAWVNLKALGNVDERIDLTQARAIMIRIWADSKSEAPEPSVRYLDVNLDGVTDGVFKDVESLESFLYKTLGYDHDPSFCEFYADVAKNSAKLGLTPGGK